MNAIPCGNIVKTRKVLHHCIKLIITNGLIYFPAQMEIKVAANAGEAEQNDKIYNQRGWDVWPHQLEAEMLAYQIRFKKVRKYESLICL